jgi:hypothetical protein
MNLYNYSQANNYEMGIYLTKKDNQDLYNEILAEAKRLTQRSSDAKISYKEVEKSPPKKKAVSDKPKKTSSKGFCIRCEKSIPLNPTRPYCRDCYHDWVEYDDEDEEYEEEVCHICGNDNPSTLLRPACRPCYRKNKSRLEFLMTS